MPTTINIDENMLLDYHEELTNELFLLYHVHPTKIPHINLSDHELAEMGEHDAMGRTLVEQFTSRQTSTSKKVGFFRKPFYSNGLPRR